MVSDSPWRWCPAPAWRQWCKLSGTHRHSLLPDETHNRNDQKTHSLLHFMLFSFVCATEHRLNRNTMRAELFQVSSHQFITFWPGRRSQVHIPAASDSVWDCSHFYSICAFMCPVTYSGVQRFLQFFWTLLLTIITGSMWNWTLRHN